MTKYKVVRLKELTYNKLVEMAKYGDSIDSVILKLINATLLQQNTGGKKQRKLLEEENKKMEEHILQEGLEQ